MFYIFIKKHTLVQHFFTGLKLDSTVRVLEYPYLKHSRLHGLLRGIEANLLWWLPLSWCYDEGYLSQLRSINPDDSVLFFSIENRKTLQIVRKFIRARKQSVWLWDPIHSYRNSAFSRWFYKSWLRRSGLDTYTFDPRDAKEFGIGLLEQVFRHDPVAQDQEVAKDIDLCFVGTDKRRLPELLRWKDAFEQQGLRTCFHVVADRRNQYGPKERALVTDKWISYAENLDLARRSKCILELLQGTQSGPTLRSIEALFLGCKLITNNASIVDCGFYHPSRIFVIGHDRVEDLQAFLRMPMEVASDELLSRHEIKTWLRRFE